MNSVSRLDFSILGKGIDYYPFGHVNISSDMAEKIKKTFMEICSILTNDNIISDEAYSTTTHSLMSIFEPTKSFTLDDVLKISQKLTENGYNISEFSYVGIPDHFFDIEPYIHFSILIN